MTYYQVLGVTETATDRQIRDAYRNAVRRVQRELLLVRKTLERVVEQLQEELQGPEESAAFHIRR